MNVKIVDTQNVEDDMIKRKYLENKIKEFDKDIIKSRDELKACLIKGIQGIFEVSCIDEIDASKIDDMYSFNNPYKSNRFKLVKINKNERVYEFIDKNNNVLTSVLKYEDQDIVELLDFYSEFVFCIEDSNIIITED